MQRDDIEDDAGKQMITEMAEAAEVEPEAEEPQVEEQSAPEPQGLMAKGE